jgi:tetratricopeptide (TPR) repeat protein
VKHSFFEKAFRVGIVLWFLFTGERLAMAQSEPDWLSLSFDYLEQNRLDSAEWALKTVLKNDPVNPLNPFLLNNLGTIQRRMGKNNEALLSYTAALGQHPRQPVFLEARASLFAEMGQANNAILDYSTLLDEKPAEEEALYQRGLLYLQIKDTERAEADFKRMLEQNPNGFYARRGFAALAKFRGDYEEAEKIYNYLLDKLPEDAGLYAGRAELYLLMNRPGQAAADATRAIRLSGEALSDPYLYLIRYRAKLLLHETKAAADDLEKAKTMKNGKLVIDN